MTISKHFEGSAIDHEVMFYRCRCISPPVQALERFNGGEWTWRAVPREHKR